MNGFLGWVNCESEQLRRTFWNLTHEGSASDRLVQDRTNRERSRGNLWPIRARNACEQWSRAQLLLYKLEKLLPILLRVDRLFIFVMLKNISSNTVYLGFCWQIQPIRVFVDFFGLLKMQQKIRRFRIVKDFCIQPILGQINVISGQKNTK